MSYESIPRTSKPWKLLMLVDLSEQSENTKRLVITRTNCQLQGIALPVSKMKVMGFYIDLIN